ncbi:hypothetical protein AVEN_267725-2-1, partial [Araneus ventricosus]
FLIETSSSFCSQSSVPDSEARGVLVADSRFHDQRIRELTPSVDFRMDDPGIDMLILLKTCRVFDTGARPGGRASTSGWKPEFTVGAVRCVRGPGASGSEDPRINNGISMKVRRVCEPSTRPGGRVWFQNWKASGSRPEFH